MQQPTTSNFMAEKEGMIYFYQSTPVTTQTTALFTDSYENLKYHSKAKNATSISPSVHNVASFTNLFRIFKIKVIFNQQ
jgi:hypothetical protein